MRLHVLHVSYIQLKPVWRRKEDTVFWNDKSFLSLTDTGFWFDSTLLKNASERDNPGLTHFGWVKPV